MKRFTIPQFKLRAFFWAIMADLSRPGDRIRDPPSTRQVTNDQNVWVTIRSRTGYELPYPIRGAWSFGQDWNTRLPQWDERCSLAFACPKYICRNSHYLNCRRTSTILQWAYRLIIPVLLVWTRVKLCLQIIFVVYSWKISIFGNNIHDVMILSGILRTNHSIRRRILINCK